MCNNCLDSLRTLHEFYVMVKENLQLIAVKEVEFSMRLEEITTTTPSKKEAYIQTCEYCGRAYTGKAARSNLEAHIRAKHLNVFYTCDLCGQKIASRCNLRTHMSRMHLASDKRYKCQKCGRKVKNLPAHNHVNHGDPTQRHACSYCGKVFRQRGLLRSHVRMVHEPPTFKCSQPECGRMFRRKRSRDQHIAMHTGAGLYPCKFCDFVTNYINNHSCHMRRYHPQEYLEKRKKYIQQHFPDSNLMITDQIAFQLPDLLKKV